ncbi:MAG: hypothetical protein IME92_08790 [Proteobacteria bacterium]|nr:hypothetical protein [Pseudomonadota bacterium]
MDILFEKICEPDAGSQWQRRFDALWPYYRKWYLSEGIAARQTYLAGYRAIKVYMPELLPTYERLCELAGGGDIASRFLSFYRPPPYLSGCSQAVWLRDYPMLVRNYDYDPMLIDSVILNSRWNDKQVIATTDGMWGVVDGMNDAGLAVSLTFGGRRIVGDGFGVPLILRYILEFCDTTKDAIEVLKSVPCHMAYNVTTVDKSGDYITAYLCPGTDTVLAHTRISTNHQENVEWHRHAQVTATVERERFLLQRLTLHDDPPEKFIANFLKPPLYSTKFNHNFGTLYTAVYKPTTGSMEIHWPGEVWHHNLKDISNSKRRVRYPDAAGKAAFSEALR